MVLYKTLRWGKVLFYKVYTAYILTIIPLCRYLALPLSVPHTGVVNSARIWWKDELVPFWPQAVQYTCELCSLIYAPETVACQICHFGPCLVLPGNCVKYFVYSCHHSHCSGPAARGDVPNTVPPAVHLAPPSLVRSGQELLCYDLIHK